MYNYSLTQKIPPTTQVGKIPLAAHTYGSTLYNRMYVMYKIWSVCQTVVLISYIHMHKNPFPSFLTIGRTE